MRDEAIFDVVFRACAEQALHPDRNCGGIIGRAAAVVKALGLDGDAPLSSLAAPVSQEADRCPMCLSKRRYWERIYAAAPVPQEDPQ